MKLSTYRIVKKHYPRDGQEYFIIQKREGLFFWIDMEKHGLRPYPYDSMWSVQHYWHIQDAQERVKEFKERDAKLEFAQVVWED